MLAIYLSDNRISLGAGMFFRLAEMMFEYRCRDGTGSGRSSACPARPWRGEARRGMAASAPAGIAAQFAHLGCNVIGVTFSIDDLPVGVTHERQLDTRLGRAAAPNPAA